VAESITLKIFDENGNRLTALEYLQSGWKALTPANSASYWNLQAIGDMQSIQWKCEQLIPMLPPVRATILRNVYRDVTNYLDTLKKDEEKRLKSLEKKGIDITTQKEELDFFMEQINVSASMTSAFNYCRPFIRAEDEDLFIQALYALTVGINERKNFTPDPLFGKQDADVPGTGVETPGDTTEQGINKVSKSGRKGRSSKLGKSKDQ
jgi:hypothetical protein